MNRGGVPGGVKPLECQSLSEHSNGLMGGRHNGPAQPTGLHLLEETHREERLAAAGKTAQDERNGGIRLLEPVGESISGLLLITGENQRRMGRGAHPNA